MQDKTLNVRASLQVTSNFQTQAQTMQATLIVEAEVAKAFAYTYLTSCVGHSAVIVLLPPLGMLSVLAPQVSHSCDMMTRKICMFDYSWKLSAS